MLCKHCQELILPTERHQAGYDYCKEYKCVGACQEKPRGIIVSNLHKQGPMVFSTNEIMGKNAYDRG